MSDDILHTGRADIHHPKGPARFEPDWAEYARVEVRYPSGVTYTVEMNSTPDCQIEGHLLFERESFDLPLEADASRTSAPGEQRTDIALKGVVASAVREVRAEPAAQQPLSRDEQWTYDYLRRVAAHDSPRWDVAAREIEARVRADALRQAAQMLVTQPHVLDEIACANLLEAVARETTCGPNCREAHTYATECAAPRAVAAGEEQPMPDASRDAVELAARILFEAGQVATDEETWQGITGDDRDSYRRVARAQLDAVAAASHLRGEPAARDARVRAGALRSFAASMRTLAEQAPEGEPASWPWTAYALAAVKAEEHAGKGFPSEQADRTPDVDTPDHSQRFWWHHGDHLPLDSSPCAPTPGTAEGPADQCVGCGAGWTTVAWRRGEAVPSLPEETPAGGIE